MVNLETRGRKEEIEGLSMSLVRFRLEEDLKQLFLNPRVAVAFNVYPGAREQALKLAYDYLRSGVEPDAVPCLAVTHSLIAIALIASREDSPAFRPRRLAHALIKQLDEHLVVPEQQDFSRKQAYVRIFARVLGALGVSASTLTEDRLLSKIVVSHGQAELDLLCEARFPRKAFELLYRLNVFELNDLREKTRTLFAAFPPAAPWATTAFFKIVDGQFDSPEEALSLARAALRRTTAVIEASQTYSSEIGRTVALQVWLGKYNSPESAFRVYEQILRKAEDDPRTRTAENQNCARHVANWVFTGQCPDIDTAIKVLREKRRRGR